MGDEPKASASFIEEARVFQEPGAFAEMLERHRAGMTRDQLYRQAGYQEFKDAWQAVMFALGYQEAHKKLTVVRICAPEEFPDFQVRMDGTVFDFEATVFLEDGRRMGDDYRADDQLGPAMRDKPEDLPASNSESWLRRSRARRANSMAHNRTLPST